MSLDVEGVSAGDDTKKGEYRARGQWSNKFEFVLSCVAYAVGLGNVWRFPYLCYKNGGGAFLIPYLICVVAGGVPLFLMEIALGQYTGQGGISVWDICPLLKGIGIGATIMSFYVKIYYIIVIAWAVLFLFYSLTSELPWAHCNNPWNTPNCFSLLETHHHNDTEPEHIINEEGIPHFNDTPAELFPAEIFNGSYFTSVVTSKSIPKVDAAVEFWERKVLEISEGIDYPGHIQWPLAVCLLIAWFFSYICVWGGVKSTGKAVYVVATFPYVMLTLLIVRGLTLPGAWDGIIFYLNPDFSRLSDAQVWIDAGTQVFYSYAIAIGCLTALGSYNQFHNNFFRQGIFVACCNSGTSLYAGFAVFSALGFMAHEQGAEVKDVASSGPGLVFIAYPKAVAQMPLAPFWAVLFFFMILMLGVGSHSVGVEGFITNIVDIFPNFLRKGRRREYFVGITCVICYFLGLPMVTQGGMYLLQIFDYYSASGIVLLWLCFFEGFAVAWVYKAERFYDNIEEMLGYRITRWFLICWKYFVPFITVGIFSFCMISYSPMRYNNTYDYPVWAHVLGWLLQLSSMSAVPAMAIYQLYKTPGTFRQRLKILTTPAIGASPSRVEKEKVETVDLKENGKIAH